MSITEKHEEHLSYRQVSRKGGSIYVTLPSEVVSNLNLQLGDTLDFYKNKDGETCIRHVDVIYKTASGLEFNEDDLRKNKNKKL